MAEAAEELIRLGLGDPSYGLPTVGTPAVRGGVGDPHLMHRELDL